ncbi:MAG: hypothetical protein OXK80_02735 [Bdellovibrionales bacterium]|nr:hypothetical protein [Bdellovibrionales bacterium]
MKAILISFLLVFCSLAVSQEPLTLEEIPQAITEYNKRESRSITSLKDLNDMYLLIEGALSTDEYMKRHNLTKRKFIKKVFSQVDHLTPEALAVAIVDWNSKQAFSENKESVINSISRFNTFYNRIYGALSLETYRVLYDLKLSEFLHIVFGIGNNDDGFASLQQLPQAIARYHSSKGARFIASAHIYDHYYGDIQGALSRETYQALNNIRKTEFVQFVFSRIEHLTPEELPQAIKNYHRRVQAVRISSLNSYNQNRSRIPGALSVETYKTLYGVTREQFNKILESINYVKTFTTEEIKEYEREQAQKSKSRTQPDKTNNGNIPTLTWKQTVQAIIEYNKPEAQNGNGHIFHPIDSWASYRKHREGIPGADSVENLERQYLEENKTLSGFTLALLGEEEKTLTPLELSRAIAKYNSEVLATEQIDYIEDYEIFYYRIPHAPTIETFKKYAEELWKGNNQFQEKFRTVDRYVEHVIVSNVCMESFGK